MITEDFCSYEVAKLLKEKGFDGFKHYGWDEELFDKEHPRNFSLGFDSKEHWISCPTHQMAMKWLREEKRISIIIEFDLTKRGYCPYVYQLDYDMDWVVKWRINTPMKYEEAVEAALKYALENLI